MIPIPITSHFGTTEIMIFIISKSLRLILTVKRCDEEGRLVEDTRTSCQKQRSKFCEPQLLDQLRVVPPDCPALYCIGNGSCCSFPFHIMLRKFFLNPCRGAERHLWKQGNWSINNAILQVCTVPCSAVRLCASVLISTPEKSTRVPGAMISAPSTVTTLATCSAYWREMASFADNRYGTGLPVITSMCKSGISPAPIVLLIFYWSFLVCLKANEWGMN